MVMLKRLEDVSSSRMPPSSVVAAGPLPLWGSLSSNPDLLGTGSWLELDDGDTEVPGAILQLPNLEE